MNSSFPGGMKDNEVLIATSQVQNDNVLREIEAQHPTYKKLRWGERVAGADGQPTRFPVFGKHESD